MKKAGAPNPAAQKTAGKSATKAAAQKPAKKTAKKAAAAQSARTVAKTPAKKPAAKKAPAKTAKKKAAPPNKAARQPQSDLLKRILTSLDDDKAENIVTVDLDGRSALCDAAVIASGRSSRHVAAMAEHLSRRLKEAGYGTRPVSGATQGDWVLVDAGDVIVHLFRPEVRDYYDLEGMWSVGGRR